MRNRSKPLAVVIFLASIAVLPSCGGGILGDDFDFDLDFGCWFSCPPGPAFFTQVRSVTDWKTGNQACGLTLEGELLCRPKPEVDAYESMSSSLRFESLYNGCALTKEHEAYCWGENEFESRVPGRPKLLDELTRLPGLWKSLAIGSRSCGIKADDDGIWCWGIGFYDLRATDVVERDASEVTKPVSLQITDGTWQSIAMGVPRNELFNFDLSLLLCGLQTSNRLTCFHITYDDWSKVIDFDSDWTRVEIVSGQVCGLTKTGRIDCFREVEGYYHPFSIEGVWTSLDANGDTFCAVATDRSLGCWGALPGNGELYSSHYIRYRKKNWAAVDLSNGICALKEGGTLHCLPAVSNGFFSAEPFHAAEPVMVDAKTLD